jgi:hypothetical protein
MVNKRAIEVDTLDRMAKGFQKSRGIPHKLTTEEMIELAEVPAASGENPLAKMAKGTLTEIKAEDLQGVTAIANYAFYKNFNFVSIELPYGVTTIGNRAFAETDKLKTLILPDSLEIIGDSAFELSQIESIRIPPKITEISSYAFYGCSKLKTITIPNAVKYMHGSNIFARCTSLENIRIGNGVRYIGTATFIYCDALTDIYIDKPEGSIEGAPWGAENAQIHWNTPLPNDEV